MQTRTRKKKRGFTIIELLVALILLAVAAAGLVRALTGDRKLRDLAASHAFAATQTRERLEWLAALPCAGPASGSSAAVWGSERWHATAVTANWSLTDSLVLRASTVPLVIEARIACPE